MKKQGRIKISQCMIVKNEEKNIRQALSWGKGIVYEQIVVDTGSTDRTVEIAKEMGAKVYHFTWINDFSAAKNFALNKAKGDWIAFLDADEYLTEEWAKKLPILIEKVHQTKCIAIRSPLVSIDDEGGIISVARQWRFFRWLPQLRYKNPIHEVLAFCGQVIPDEAMWDTQEEFPILHTGYANSVATEKHKYERNTEILKSELEKRPNDHHVMGYLGDSYRAEGNPKEAEAWYRKSIEAMPEKTGPREERSAMTYVYMLVLLFDKGEEPPFLELYDKAKAYLPWVYDIDFVAGWFYVREERYDKALEYLERAQEIMNVYGKEAYGIYMPAMLPEYWEKLALCYYHTGNYRACVEKCVILLKEDKSRVNGLAILLAALKCEEPAAIVRFLTNLYNLDAPSDRILILRAGIRAGASAFLEVFKTLCSEEEQKVLEQLQKKQQ